MVTWIKQHQYLLLVCIASIFSISSTVFFYNTHSLLLYGDAESHLNIAKRVVDSITPGFAQLGGIWLPLPHLLMVPLVIFDPLWQTGIAGSIIGGISYVVTSIYMYKMALLFFGKRFSAIFVFLFFALNPNILYMQSTALGELPLIAFFILSAYYFFVFLKNTSSIPPLLFAAFFGFCATLCRYDGWFLVLCEVIILAVYFVVKRQFRKGEGFVVLFSTLAFFGIFLWFLWNGLILHDPMYFTNSPFSAKAQQQGWLARGQLLTYKNLQLSIAYYLDGSMRNVGIFTSIITVVGIIIFLLDTKQQLRFSIFVILGFPLFFYIITLYMGQSIMLLPDLTPASFPWHLFNARYGIIMIPFAAFFAAVVANQLPKILRIFLILLFIEQLVSFSIGIEPVITYADGKEGLSAMKAPDAQIWMANHYDKGKVLLDDYARTISIIKSNIPMQNIVYIGNHPYWENALKQPQTYVTWVVMQKNDAVWNKILSIKSARDNLYKYYQKVYTSPTIVIFKRNTLPA
jgi:hypothetical protein